MRRSISCGAQHLPHRRRTGPIEHRLKHFSTKWMPVRHSRTARPPRGSRHFSSMPRLTTVTIRLEPSPPISCSTRCTRFRIKRSAALPRLSRVAHMNQKIPERLRDFELICVWNDLKRATMAASLVSFRRCASSAPSERDDSATSTRCRCRPRPGAPCRRRWCGCARR